MSVMAESELLKNLNDAQKSAVTHEAGPLLIVAGAGTGKTTVITSKIAWLVMEKGIRPEEILALTFTEKSAAEMEERVDKLLPLGYTDLWISTFHSFADRILKEHALDIGLPDNYKLLSETDQWLLVRRNLNRFNLDYYRPLGNPTKFIHALLKLFSRAKDEEIFPADYLQYAEDLRLNSDSAEFLRTALSEEEIKKLPKAEAKELLAEEILRQQEIADSYHVYQQLLLENNALDFGDLISYVLKLLKTRKNILTKYRSQFKYILVDEFQDVNYAQYELVKLLAAPQNNLTVVGDDDQSIYRFRGASVSNILQFKDDFPESQEILLTDNYRSSQNILDLAYNFIQLNNPDRLEVRLSTGDKKLSKQLVSHSETPGRIEHLFGQTLSDEVELTVNQIINLYNESSDINWSDFAILVRANHSADEFIKALETAQVPYLFLASKGLYRQPIILDLLSWFRCLDDYHEGAAMYRVLNFDLWKLNHGDIVNLNYWAYRKGYSLFEVCRQNAVYGDISPAGRKKLAEIISLMEKHSALVKAGKKPSLIMWEFLNDSGYLKALTAVDSADVRQQLAALNQFYKKIIEFEKEALAPTLKEFMMLMEMELESGNNGSLKPNLEDSGPDTVKVMTIHASKGLEFKYVFIVNLVDKKFPTIGKSDPIELPVKLTKEILPEGDVHLQEERRLFYVAMTRAKTGLFLTSAADYGGARDKKPSRFLVELAEQGNFNLNPQAVASSSRLAEIDAKQQAVKLLKEQDKQAQLSVPQAFSFTQLSLYEKCPYQYRYANILKIPTAGKPHFSFGKSMHATMQKFFILARQRSASGQQDIFGAKAVTQPITWEEVKKIYDDNFIDDWYETRQIRDEYYSKGLESIRNFFDSWQKNPTLAENLELGFTFRIGKNYALRGSIDRIDQEGDGLRIIDYKTGQAKAKLEAEDKEQLLIYQMAAEEVLKQKVNRLTFYYFSGNSELDFLGKPAEIDKLRDKLVTAIDNIKAGEFPPKPNEQACKWCDFREICDFAA